VRILFDLETDGLLDKLTRVHCGCLVRDESLTVERYHDDPALPRTGTLAEMLALMDKAEAVGAHNALLFDIPALEKVYGWKPKGRVFDSRVVASSVWPDEHLRALDAISKRELPKKVQGRNTIEAWGYRFGDRKGERPESWETLTQEMLDYCAQDVVVLAKLVRKINGHQPTREQIELEQEFFLCIQRQIDAGFAFDVARAEKLVAKLMARRAELDTLIRAAFPDFVDVRYTPKKKLRREDVTPFNPNSRQHIARGLSEKHGWRPKEFTPTGLPKVDETVMAALPYPEAKMLAEHALVQKRLGTLAEGDNAWLKLVQPDGRIHGYVAHNGAVTSRCTHRKPNTGNVPTTDAEYGTEMRECWVAAPGYVLVIGDASGIEARLLAHYAARFDGGELGRFLLEGDIHTRNAQVLGIPTRAKAKEFLYAVLYGAQDTKAGEILGGSRAFGKLKREKLLTSLPGLGRVIAGATADAKAYGYVVTLDGRRLWVRYAHAALNTLIQGAGAIVGKKAIVLLHRRLRELGVAFKQVGYVHDEIVVECRPEDAGVVAQALRDAIAEAGRHFRLRVPLESKVVNGPTWAAKAA